MDILIRFEDADMVKLGALIPHFLMELLQLIPEKPLYQGSNITFHKSPWMGPSFRAHSRKWETENLSSFADIATCGLGTIHDSLK